ncbi:MAG: PAS domain S-box protein, partial [Cyanobacteria bacterium P01_H01_bin.130]
MVVKETLAESIIPEGRSLLHTEAHDPCITPEWLEPYRLGRVRIVDDIQKAAMTMCHQELLTGLDIRAKMMVPIVVDEILWGLMVSSYQDKPFQWRSEDIAWAQHLARHGAIAIKQALAYEQTEKELERRRQAEAVLEDLNHTLERIVRARTTELQERQAFIQTILDTVPIPIFWKDRQSSFLGANAAFLDIVGLERMNQLVGKTDFDFEGTRAMAEHYRTDDQAVMTSGQPKLGIVESIQGPDGQLLDLETNKAPVRNIAGEVIGIVGTIQDVTERRAAESAIARQLAAMEASVEGIGIAQNGQFIYVNRAHLEIFGYTHPEDLLGQSYEILYSPEEYARLGREAMPVVQEKQFWQGEIIATRQDGSTFHQELSLTAMEADLIVCVCRDITERKETESLIARQIAAIEAYVEGIAIFQEGQFRYANRAHLELFGYDHAEEVLGQSYRILYTPEGITWMQQQVMPIVREQKFWRGKNTSVRKDGSLFTMELSMTMLDDGLLICVCRDVTERERAEAKAQALLNQTQLLHEISFAVRASLDLSTIVQNTVESLFKCTDGDICAFGWYEAEGENSNWSIVAEAKAAEAPSWTGFHSVPPVAPLRYAIATERVYHVKRSTGGQTIAAEQRFLEDLGVSSYICLPLKAYGDRVGLLQLGRVNHKEGWMPEAIELLQEIGLQMAIAINQSQLYEESQAKTRALAASYQKLKDTQLQLVQAEKMSGLGQLVAGIAHEVNNPISFIFGNLTPASDYFDILIELLTLYRTRYPDPGDTIDTFIQDNDIGYLIEDFPKLLRSINNGADR